MPSFTDTPRRAGEQDVPINLNETQKFADRTRTVVPQMGPATSTMLDAVMNPAS